MDAFKINPKELFSRSAARHEQRRQQAEQDKPRRRRSVLTWRGVLDDSPLSVRVIVAFALVVEATALAFTQLGFVSVTLPNGTIGYVIVLLHIVAMGALLLGTVAGTAIGLATGAILLLHAQLLPLDHYELEFVTPFTSVVMFGIAGLVLGVQFAFALRDGPGQARRMVRIALICIVASWAYSLGLIASALVSLLFHMSEVMTTTEVSEAAVTQMAAPTISQFGNLIVQAWCTALLMAVACIITDFVSRRLQAYKGSVGLRTLFGARLAIVVTLALLSMSAASFAAATADETNDAQEHMQRRIDYIEEQLRLSNERQRLIQEAHRQGEFDYDKVDEATLAELADSFEDRLLLSGYSPEDFLILVTVEDFIYACNDERLQGSIPLVDAFGPGIEETIERSIDTGELQRFVLDEGTLPAPADGGMPKDAEESRGRPGPHLAYLLAESVPDFGGGQNAQGQALRQRVIMIQSSDQVFANRPKVMIAMVSSSLFLLLAVFGIVSLLLSRMVAQRIDETNDALARITDGDLDTRVEVRDTREFESLSNGINQTVDALQDLIAEAESRMDAELDTARTIQESALPQVFPPYPDIKKFDVFASMEPARQVGGDFYDFFLIGDCDVDAGRLGVVVADVSGKGVPAALFMMKAKAQIRDYLLSGLSIAEAVNEANRQLCDGNEAGMFVTAWVGVLDYATGHLDYVNAGHNPPLLWKRSGGWQRLSERSGTMLGLFEDMPYFAYELDCDPKDTLLIYTDGVTEAWDVEERCYGEERLMEALGQAGGLHPRELVELVRGDVASYARGAEQSDDITVLALGVGMPPEVTETLEVPATIDELDRVNDFLHAELDRRLCPSRVQGQLDIAVEELFVNVCNYAYPEATTDEPGRAQIRRTYHANPSSITVEIIDWGVPFDPLAKPDVVRPSDVTEIKVGGLGIMMTRQVVDVMSYRREGGRNIVSIVKRW